MCMAENSICFRLLGHDFQGIDIAGYEKVGVFGRIAETLQLFRFLRHDLPAIDADFFRKLDKIRILAKSDGRNAPKTLLSVQFQHIFGAYYLEIGFLRGFF